PHSEFMEPIKYDELKKDTQGEFGGVGVQISIKDNSITVIAPMEDTPGFKAGILSGDRIIKINGKSTERISLPDAVKLLRGKPGGLLDQAVKVCEKFLPRNQLVVSTEGRDAKQKAEYRASGRDRHPSIPIVVLVNYGSASASEIVAGCLQDATALGVCKAIVVGEQTFGKGSVQSILPLQDGSALRLTTAKYYTPSHKVIHEKGIT